MTKLPHENIKREILVRKEAKASEKFGTRPAERTVEDLLQYGIVNIDKPSGPTSHQVSAYVKRILHIEKSGHTGTLDPKVTGVLPVPLNKATRIVQTLLTAGKEYVCVMHLHDFVPREKLMPAFKKFTGRLKQLPPVKSSVKRQYRFRRVYYVHVLEIKGKDILFKIGCQAGTYIRKYCHDLGRHLGVGAHMAELRRTKAGPFTEDTLFSLQDLEDAFYFYKEKDNEKFIRKVIQPVENGIAHLPKVWVLNTTVNSLCNGANLAVPGIAKTESHIEKEDRVAVLTLKGELILYGTSKMTSQNMLKEKGIAVITDRVLMEPGWYK